MIYFYPLVLEYLIHPRNPHVPALSGSYRYIEATTTKGKKLAWLAGGHNLQPVYIVQEVGKVLILMELFKIGIIDLKSL